jgi:lipopolysaccharide transport system permease protein
MPMPGQQAPNVIQEVRIEPVRSRLQLSAILRSAPVIKVLAQRDLKARYKQSLLGPIWIAFQPLALLAGYVVGFRGVTTIGTGHVPYAVFALAGITIWAYFQAAAVAGTASIVSNGALVMKTSCPRFAFPLASLLSCLPSLLVPFAASIVAAVVAGLASPRLLLLPLPILWLFVVTTGLIACTSAITVRFRDLVSAIPFLLQVGAFVVPVGYPVSTLSPTLRAIVSLNPLTGVIEAWRWVVLDTGRPYMTAIYLSLAIGALTIVGGYRVFGRFEVRMADVI